jgi:hypothetical protein
MATSPSPDQEIARIRHTIARLQQRVEQGERVDLAGLTRDVGGLCEQLAAMPEETARPHAPALEQVMGDLNGLEGLLRNQQADLDKRLSVLSDQDTGTTA